MTRLTIIAKLFIALMLAMGVAALANGVLHLKLANALQFIVYLVLTLAASRLRVRLPGVPQHFYVSKSLKVVTSSVGLTRGSLSRAGSSPAVTEVEPAGRRRS